MPGDSIKTSKNLFILPIAVWIVSGYPLRQFFPEKIGLIFSGAGLLLCIYLMLMLLLLNRKLIERFVIKRRLWKYSILWLTFITWGFFSNIWSPYGSVLYQVILLIGVLSALIVGYLRSVSLTRLFKLAMWMTFPLVLYWWVTRFLSGPVLDVTYRNAAYGVITIVALSSAAFLLPFPMNGLMETIILISLLLNGQRISFFAGLIVILIHLAVVFRNRRGAWNERNLSFLTLFASVFLIVLLLNFGRVTDFIVGDILMWHDPLRGASAGFSSRFLIWKESWEHVVEKPILGWGTRANETLLLQKSSIVASSTHNGLLANLVDYGFPGAVLSVILMGWPIWIAARKAWKEGDTEYWMVFTLGVSYLFLSFGERYFFNVGNPTSVVVLISLFQVMSGED